MSLSPRQKRLRAESEALKAARQEALEGVNRVVAAHNADDPNTHYAVASVPKLPPAIEAALAAAHREAPAGKLPGVFIIVGNVDFALDVKIYALTEIQSDETLADARAQIDRLAG